MSRRRWSTFAASITALVIFVVVVVVAAVVVITLSVQHEQRNHQDCRAVGGVPYRSLCLAPDAVLDVTP